VKVFVPLLNISGHDALANDGSGGAELTPGAAAALYDGILPVGAAFLLAQDDNETTAAKAPVRKNTRFIIYQLRHVTAVRLPYLSFNGCRPPRQSFRPML
jgi:hypothetical protein